MIVRGECRELPKKILLLMSGAIAYTRSGILCIELKSYCRHKNTKSAPMDKTYGRKNAAFSKVCDTCYIRYTKNGVHLPFLEKV